MGCCSAAVAPEFIFKEVTLPCLLMGVATTVTSSASQLEILSILMGSLKSSDFFFFFYVQKDNISRFFLVMRKNHIHLHSHAEPKHNQNNVRAKCMQFCFWPLQGQKLHRYKCLFTCIYNAVCYGRYLRLCRSRKSSFYWRFLMWNSPDYKKIVKI